MMEKLKSFLFEQEEADNNTNSHNGKKRRRGRRQGEMDRRRRIEEAGGNDYNKWGYALIAVFVPITLLILWLSNKQNVEIPLNDFTLCPADERHISRKTYILMDLSEPLSELQQGELQKLIEVASENLQKHERISISRMEPDPDNPRVPLFNLCNSVDIKSITDAVGRSVYPKKDCHDIINKKFKFHPRVGDPTRERIRGICKDRDDLNKKIKDAVKTVPGGNTEQKRSYIIGSIEDIISDASGGPRDVPIRLIVFSDMIQNANWFSQYREQHGSWTIDNINQRRKKYAPDHMKTPPKNNFDEVLLCYQPSSHTILKRAEKKNAHRGMWKEYFKGSIFLPVTLGGCPDAIAKMMEQ
ncbi:hypothetical protein [Candidatus Spongiihabitans sp.]|uniref:hypothetical protein n=1 Tax=Candidatus Spongiihabitans sp. TaxID=3101308 RepID=UPI003C7045D3